jgi:hypothetical protein
MQLFLRFFFIGLPVVAQSKNAVVSQSPFFPVQQKAIVAPQEAQARYLCIPNSCQSEAYVTPQETQFDYVA